MKFIIPIIVGAIIGYITNWFAIKMLFRPYEEIKIWGIHVPFTPGLIPKEKGRIAKSVGQTIAVHLLSPEIVTESLCNDKMNDQVNAWVEHNIDRLKESDKSIKTLIMSIGNENYDKLLNIIVERVTVFICYQLKSEKFKDGIMDLIENKVFLKYNDDFYEIIKEKAESYLYELSTSEEIKTLFNNAVDDKINSLIHDERTLGEIVPEDVVEAIKIYIDEHDEKIENVLHDMFENPDIKIRLKELITKIISQNVSKLITMFMGSEQISEKVLSSIENNIDNPETINGVILIIKTSIDKLLETKISDIASGISSNISSKDASQISEIVFNYISNKETQKELTSILEEKLKESEPSVKENLLKLISNKMETILNSQLLYDKVFIIVQDIVEKSLNKPISYILKDIDETTIASIGNFANNIFNGFVKNKLPYIIDLLNISKVVENQINSFDVAFAEKIIVEIANKELKAITWLGALLGGIMGILTPLMQNIYK
ncbi:DUF445 family protein [Anaerosalibacter sp. Marseille-P3206]|uniref:DUF445 family protein n=1 Tax=Anaerosalibacter sp. Marseille-P3206 TaxID=1871005 RepID=UPI0009878E04|nr:DUF445 family protein [Anaerosalibacter sp. Marseille-P3206]